MSMPSPSDLTYFVEVASSLNLSRAAERLGISQPSLTLAIQRLEHSVGTPLLIRSKRGVTLTQSGKQLLVHARELLQRWDAVKGQALASVHEIQGSYTLGCHPSVALYSLAKFLPELQEKNPGLEIRLLHELSRKVTEAVIRMEADLGIVINPVRHPDLVLRKLCDDEVTVWVGDGRRKVQDHRTGEAVLICDPEMLQTQDLLGKLKKCGIGYSRVLASSNLEVITQLVAHGAGIGIIPQRVVNSSRYRNLKRVPKAPVFRDEIFLTYRVENKLIRSIQAISEGVIEAFA
ncbi:MAG: LysR family transcriptional regulator [Methylotenera sp.]|nr:LysR family transcriptional regulator [Oligoflexia bacterium]